VRPFRSVRDLLCCLPLAIGGLAAAQPAADGYDWRTIGAAGNAPYTGFSDPSTPTAGRGGVGYEYRMGRTEVTTAQWVEFFNAALARPDRLAFADLNWWTTPVTWGGRPDPSYQGPGTRFMVRTDIPNAGLIPSGSISWRMAAVLCNWMHNDKRTDAAAFMSGAYDVSTFNPEDGGFMFTDQRTRSEGARYWIPSMDEYLKAAFFDPDGGPGGTGRWWSQPNGTDTPLVYGPPPAFGGDGTGQANAGFRFANQTHFYIPLLSYPGVESPWGLMDLAGGTSEWTEEVFVAGDLRESRVLDGSRRGSNMPNPGQPGLDPLLYYGSDNPWSNGPDFGFRLASAVPGPGSVSVLAIAAVVLFRRRRVSNPALRLGRAFV
jgi:formylglycine-generating enzyme required for sulfatase activity